MIEKSTKSNATITGHTHKFEQCAQLCHISMYDYTNINTSLSQRIGMSIEKYKYPYVCYVCMVYAIGVITYMHMCTSTCLHINITHHRTLISQAKKLKASLFSQLAFAYIFVNIRKKLWDSVRILPIKSWAKYWTRLMVLTLMKTWSSKAFSD